MLCETCQYKNEADANFCANCGSMLVQTCTECGCRNSPKAASCIRCGSPLQTPAKIQGSTNRTTGIFATRAAREGERKRLSVLIADVVGSTAFIDNLNAEEAANRLGIITSAMREAVARFEGTVNKLQGDGVMALF